MDWDASNEDASSKPCTLAGLNRMLQGALGHWRICCYDPRPRLAAGSLSSGKSGPLALMMSNPKLVESGGIFISDKIFNILIFYLSIFRGGKVTHPTHLVRNGTI